MLDIGFCMLQGIVELQKVGVYAHALIKKRRYWLKYVKGDEIVEHFKDKQVGFADALPGMLDGIPVYIFGMKEPDYTMMLMATYGMLGRKGDKKTRTYTVEGTKKLSSLNTPKLFTTTTNIGCY